MTNHICFDHSYSRLLDRDKLIGATIIDFENDFMLDQIIYVVELKSGERLAMIADHWCGGRTEINFYDLI